MEGLAVLLAMVVAGSGGWSGWSYAATVLAVGIESGHYRPRITLRALSEVHAAIQRAGTAVIPVLAAVAVIAPQPEAIWTMLVRQVPVTVLLLVAGRTLAYALLRSLRRRGRLRERVVIVGAGSVGTELAALLAVHREVGLVPMGFVDEPSEAHTALPLGLKRLCSIAGLDTFLATSAVERVIVAFPRVRDEAWISVLRSAAANGVEVDVVPRFFDVGLEGDADTTDEVWGIPIQRIRAPAYLAPSWRAKRMIDVALSSLMLLAFAPLFPLIALAVRMSSPGPVLYRQGRIGGDGRSFELVKFRTMRQNHDGEGTWSASGHPDLTRVGRWLRSTSLDELPQLWNIVRGDMSLVGPRPERPQFARRFERDVPGYRERQRSPSGLTGWAQVHGLRGDTSIAERARFDNYYIEHWSLWLDVSILLRTVGVLLRSLFGTSVLPDQPAAGTRCISRWAGAAAPAVVEQTDAT